MGGPVHRMQGPDRDLGVNLGRGEFGMAEPRLDVPDIGTAFEHHCGQGVPEQVTRAVFGDPGGFHVVTHQWGHPPGQRHRGPVRAARHRRVGCSGWADRDPTSPRPGADHRPTSHPAAPTSLCRTGSPGRR